MSCPFCVVPNQCAPDGPARAASLIAYGSYGAIHGPMIASTTKNIRIRVRGATALPLAPEPGPTKSTNDSRVSPPRVRGSRNT